VLFLDAGELIDEAFRDELACVLPTTPHVGLWLTYDNWFIGRRLHHGTANRELALASTNVSRRTAGAERPRAQWKPSERTATAERDWRGTVGVKTLPTEPGIT
jgi:hypothetical protein